MDLKLSIDDAGNVSGIPEGMMLVEEKKKRKINLTDEERQRRRERALARPKDEKGKWFKKTS
jgi:hypothetical protein